MALSGSTLPGQSTMELPSATSRSISPVTLASRLRAWSSSDLKAPFALLPQAMAALVGHNRANHLQTRNRVESFYYFSWRWLAIWRSRSCQNPEALPAWGAGSLPVSSVWLGDGSPGRLQLLFNLHFRLGDPRILIGAPSMLGPGYGSQASDFGKSKMRNLGRGALRISQQQSTASATHTSARGLRHFAVYG